MHKVATPTLKLLRSPHAGYLLFIGEIAKALLSVTVLIEEETPGHTDYVGMSLC